MNNNPLQNIIWQAIAQKIRTAADLKKVKAAMAKKTGIPIVANSQILAEYRQLIAQGKLKRDEHLWALFSKRQVRNLSGVAVITVLTKPYYCPGRCVYCPTEARMPKSYLANEPGAARALGQNFDPYQQVKTRLETLYNNGHETDKCELLVLGGTWTVYEPDYQEWFLKRCFEAFNKQPAPDFETAKKINETAQHRIIGLTLETRPDYITRLEIKRMRQFGCTRVQLGVQTTDEEILRKIKRDQTNAQVIMATRLLKEAGFKISHHYMPMLPGATPAKDLQIFKDVFQTADYQPDHIKIYPTSVLKTSVLYQWWKDGKYQPYEQSVLRKLLIDMQKLIPEWVRVERVIRDIPESSVYAGNKATNLRQLLEQENNSCRCIRCREPHDQHLALKQNLQLVKRSYQASAGEEVFLSFENTSKTVLYAFLRLRFQHLKKHFIPELQDAALIREIHTYGQLAKIEGGQSHVQHLGLGRRLMQEAERLSVEAGYKKIAVIAGIGVREYFRKLNYQLAGEYMVKDL
ncbi:MAG: hypothetical protein A2233_01920 [Candidatus Kerfeldbacteria bacterium RIFOXYA2_FULL_38_24]|uniref:tRNA carboxymethyluridine synthase n=1 Tax=Candidatus Kerfeldbacteria bacterium RIFOXYB2_FULL_38_14 TaxID=1798547 RepID=A0A1G2BEL1_9BACT|nr:MAG: hypothetical protein A2319_04525 [Candidatus Kerfeldbacteria bacterium RIFOXYB2_FULL_38_14]OGY87872.1 MAG: hypothetical protein A2233_01920 [Candidatus Kerfeldbacteria bacterium RIFOXYA2_FULL_38_24]